MVDAVLLVLREVLEAALMFSLLLALSRQQHLGSGWWLWALLMGVAGSWLLAHYAYAIADALDGTGQELLNAFLYAMVALCFVVLALLLMPLLWRPGNSSHHLGLSFLFIVIVSFSLMREVSEIWIYLSSFSLHSDALSSALIGAVIGTGIGLSLGAILYYVLVFMRPVFFLPVFLLIAALLAGGLSMQIAKQLLQIGMLDSAEPLWDSSFIANEQSWFGELLYALLGYDAQPTPIQILFYLVAIAPILFALIWSAWRLRGKVNA
jgi:high-affinity iron transporter